MFFYFKNIWANPGLFLFIFVFFHITQFDKLMKACSGLEPGAVEWKVQTNPLRYGATPNVILVCVGMAQ